MKSLQLTEEHKSKLLEMCKVLFPEMFNMTISDNGFLNYSPTKRVNDYDDYIHWFEFCAMDLTTKIFNELKLYYDFDIASYRGKIIQYSDHPIDFLYEQFKKIKT